MGKKLIGEGPKTKTVESQLLIESIVVQIKEINKPASKIQLARRKRCCFDQAIPAKKNFEKFQVRPYRISVCKTLGFIVRIGSRENEVFLSKLFKL